MSMPATSRGVVFIVVGTLAALAALYMVTLAGLLISGAQVDKEIMKPFEYAGVYILGAFTGMLMNTRSNPTPPDAAVTSTTTTTSTESTKPVELTTPDA